VVVAPGRLPPQFVIDAAEVYYQTHRPGGNGNYAPSTTEEQQEFRDLMARLGIHPNRPDRNGQDKVLCPGHADTKPSLSVNWMNCVLNCLGPGELSGGLKWLREYVGEPSIRQPKPVTPSRNGHTKHVDVPKPKQPPSRNGKVLSKPPAQDYQRRLAAALSEMDDRDLPRCREGLDWSRAVLDCHAMYRANKCTSCARPVAFPVSCQLSVCTSCMPGRLAYRWLNHESAWPESMTLVLLTPRQVGDRKQVLSRFSEWRKRAKVHGRVYAIRARVVRGAVVWNVLLAVPDEGGAAPTSSRAFSVQTLASHQSPDDVLHVFQNAYIEEAQSWTTPDELLALLAAIRGRRRFQPLGKEQAVAEARTETESLQLETVKDASPARGGGSRPRMTCPWCGGKVVSLGFTVTPDRVKHVEGKGYLWTGPPRGGTP
jgi:hypothetical protein